MRRPNRRPQFLPWYKKSCIIALPPRRIDKDAHSKPKPPTSTINENDLGSIPRLEWTSLGGEKNSTQASCFYNSKYLFITMTFMSRSPVPSLTNYVTIVSYATSSASVICPFRSTPRASRGTVEERQWRYAKSRSIREYLLEAFESQSSHDNMVGPAGNTNLKGFASTVRESIFT